MLRTAGVLVLSAVVTIASCHRDVPTAVPRESVAGTYVFYGHDSQDEIELRPDGTFVRTARYRGPTKRQHGRWSMTEEGPMVRHIAFSDLYPICLQSRDPSAWATYTNAEDLLCGDRVAFIVGFCTDPTWSPQNVWLCMADSMDFLRQ